MALKPPSRLSLPEPGAYRHRATALYRPQQYEPRYAYPLLVLLHGRGGDERQLLQLMPRLSRRNYVALALRGPEETQHRRNGSIGYGWAQSVQGAKTGEGVATLYRPQIPALSEITTEFLAEYVLQAVADLRQSLNVHMERIFLVGYGEGAAVAYRLGLGLPMEFAGIVAINGWMPRVHGPLLWLPEARRLGVLIIHGQANRLVSVTEAEKAYQLLCTAGIDTTLHLLHTSHRGPGASLNLINRWVMDCCTSSDPQGSGFGVQDSAGPGLPERTV